MDKLLKFLYEIIYELKYYLFLFKYYYKYGFNHHYQYKMPEELRNRLIKNVAAHQELLERLKKVKR